MKLFKGSKQISKFGKIAATAGLAILAVGCGQQRAGQYRGFESVKSAFGESQNRVVITIQETNSDYVTGTWSAGDGTTEFSSGYFEGILKSNQIEDVVLTKNQSGNTTNPLTSGGGFQSSYSYVTASGATVCLGNYRGSLSLEGDTMAGTLKPNNTIMGMQNSCTQIDVRVSKID